MIKEKIKRRIVFENRTAAKKERSELMSRYTIFVLFLAVGGLFFPIIKPFFVPIVMAATFAGLLGPVYKWLLKHLWNNCIVASFLCCLGLVLVVLVPSCLIVRLIVEQMIVLYHTGRPWMIEFLTTWREIEIVKWVMSTQFGVLFSNVDLMSIMNFVASNLTKYVTPVVNAAYTGIFGLVFDIFIMLFVLFYFLIDGKRILARTGYLLPLKPQYQSMAYESFLLISQATIKGILIIGLVDGILGGLTLLIFGIHSWLFWGFIIAVLSILPLVGPSLVLVPAAIVQIITGDMWQGIGILIVSYTIVLNVDNVIRPYVVGNSAKMHELLVFFSTIGGLYVFGITGFIVGPVVASLLLTLLDIYAKEFRPQLSSMKRIGLENE
ncbi:MAG: AI-2E family transporter [Fibrobacter sp.]|nr:AI-2E family transporter [Fibrobacter sp.]